MKRFVFEPWVGGPGWEGGPVGRSHWLWHPPSGLNFASVGTHPCHGRQGHSHLLLSYPSAPVRSRPRFP